MDNRKPMTDKDFTFTMGKLLKQKKLGLYKLAVEKRNKWLKENSGLTKDYLPLDK
jgi:helix-turn-helix protein